MKKIIFSFLILAAFIVLAQAQNRESEDFAYPLKLYKQAFYDLAAQQFIKFYNTYPNSDKVDDAKYYAGMALYKIKEYAKARAEFQSLALEHPKSPFAAEAWFLVGDCAEKLGDFKDAARAYETLRVLYPTDTHASLGLLKAANLYLNRLHNKDKANQLFTVIIERYPSSAEYLPALVKKAKVLYLLGRPDAARKLLDKAFQIQSDKSSVLAEAYLIEGQINEQLGFVEEARKAFIQSITLAPQSEYAGLSALRLGRLHIQEARYAEAIKRLKAQLKAQKNEDIKNQIRYLLGDIYFLSAKYRMADASYQKVKTTDDSLSLILSLKRALCNEKQNFISEAISLLGRALNNYPHRNQHVFKRVFNIYLDWLQDHHYYQQASSAIYQRLNRVTDFKEKAELSARLLSVLAQKEQWAEIISLAQPYLLRQERIAQKDEMLYYVALAHEKINEPKEAEYYFNKLIHEFNASKFLPEAEKHRQFLKDFLLVDQDVALNHLAELFGEFLNAQGRSKARLSFQLGKLYFADLKNYQKAEEQFLNTLQLDTTNQGDVRLYLGKTYLKMMTYSQFTNGNAQRDYLNLARNQFKQAVIHANTCSRPDESAWLLIKTTLKSDTTDVRKEKKLVEALIAKYPQSPLKEVWMRSLAVDLAFDSSYTAESILYFKKLIQEFPRSPEMPRYLLGLARLEMPQNPQEAVHYLNQVVSDFMFSGEAAQALNDLLQFHLKNGQYAQAIKDFEKLRTYFYYSDLVQNGRAQMGDIYLKAGEYDRAIAFLQKNVETIFLNDPILLKEFSPSNVFQDIFYLANAYEKKGDVQQAVRFYRLYLMLMPKGDFSDQAHFALGHLYLKGGQYYLARENFKAVSDKNESLFAQAVIQAGDIYFLQKDYVQAAEWYARALKHIADPSLKYEIEAKYIIALIRDGKIKQAVPLIASFKKHYPKKKNVMAQFYLELGNYYRLNKNFTKAQKYFSRVKKKYKSTEYVDDAEYYNALVLITLNKHKEALKILTNFADKYPHSDRLPGVYNTLGSLYFRSEKYDASIAMFKKALDYCGNCDLEANIMTNLIKVYSLTGFWDAAQAMARSYLQKFPEAPDRLDKKIIIARAYINLNQFQKAVDYLKSIKVEATAEREPEIQFYIGEALLKAGRYEDAIAEFVKIPLLSKKTKLQWEASALYYSGQCYEKLGRIDDAIRMYKEIIKRPGIDLVLKRDAEKRIKQIQ